MRNEEMRDEEMISEVTINELYSMEYTKDVGVYVNRKFGEDWRKDLVYPMQGTRYISYKINQKTIVSEPIWGAYTNVGTLVTKLKSRMGEELIGFDIHKVGSDTAVIKAENI